MDCFGIYGIVLGNIVGNGAETIRRITQESWIFSAETGNTDDYVLAIMVQIHAGLTAE
ncbi:hypothetical protein [uncultured Cohaesibacter sp.]|uniref:hypothetical protein n=1 Tax=uncultured Cohaesibacter sp. TaxID=1002546 RepID=UPI0029C99AFE|nr:hypothetical protein [uncultured Cohaesibacter sp.]